MGSPSPPATAAKPRRRSRESAKLRSWRDLKYFFNWELIAVGIGTGLLAVLELRPFPASWPLAKWLEEWKFWLMLLAVALMVLSPMLARGLGHLRARETLLRRAGAESLALESVASRAANLVSKILQVKRRKRTNEYLDHTMSACHTYFRAREYRGGDHVDGRSGQIDVAYYRRDDGLRTRIFRKTSASDGAMQRLHGDISTRGTETAKNVIESLCEAVVLPIADFRVWSPAFARDGQFYVEGIGVPVLSSVKDDATIIGVLVVMSTAPGALHMSDVEYLRAQTWLISAAMSLDSVIELIPAGTTET